VTIGINNLSEDQHLVVKLWVAVMVMGIRDAANDIAGGLRWLNSNDKDVGSFRWICDEALHVDPDAMIRQVLKNMDVLKRSRRSLEMLDV